MQQPRDIPSNGQSRRWIADGPSGRDSSNLASDKTGSRRSRSGKLVRSNSRLTTIARSVAVTQYRQAADKTLQAMILIEEACLTALLEHRARTGGQDGMSTSEIADRIGLLHRLGPCVSEEVVSKVLCNLARSDWTEPVPEKAVVARWKIAEVEAAIRPVPVIDATARSGLEGPRNQGGE